MKKIKIAVIGADSWDRSQIKEKFAHHIKTVIESSNGIGLLNKIHKTPVHVILMHIRELSTPILSNMRKIRKAYPNIRIILLTRESDRGTETVAQAFDAGASAYFSRLDFSEFTKITEEVLQKDFSWSSQAIHLIRSVVPKDKTHLSSSEDPVLTKRELLVLKNLYTPPPIIGILNERKILKKLTRLQWNAMIKNQKGIKEKLGALSMADAVVKMAKKGHLKAPSIPADIGL